MRAREKKFRVPSGSSFRFDIGRMNRKKSRPIDCPSFKGSSHHGTEKRIKSFSKTPKPRFEIAFCTSRGRGGVNLMASRRKDPRGIVTITESA